MNLKTFEIECSLIMKFCPYNNAVAKATYKIIKINFIKNRVFASLKQLQIKLANYEVLTIHISTEIDIFQYTIHFVSIPHIKLSYMSFHQHFYNSYTFLPNVVLPLHSLHFFSMFS